MDRYQFEGYISDYIENTLSIAKRKDFDEYLDEHPESRKQVEEVHSIISQLKALPKVKTSENFMTKLQQRVNEQRDVVSVLDGKRKPMIFGFTRLTAGMMSLVILAIMFVGYELMPNGSSNPVAVPQQISTNNVLPVPEKSGPVTPANTETAIAEAQDDSSLIEEDLQKISPELEEKINYVRTK
ncbi:MAG: hypothetical protein V3R52_03500 [Candidatus Neomarinimicrobiota bacterium]